MKMGTISLSFTMLLMLNFPFLGKAQAICEGGWIRLRDSYGKGDCVLVVQEPAEWKAARGICEEKLGKLLMLDNYGDLSYNTPNVSLGRVLVNTYKVAEFWSGMHVDSSRLMWDDYGPKYVERPRFSARSWSWNYGQPDPNVGACGKAIVDRRSNNINRVIVNLTVCDTKLPFVCRKPPVVRMVKIAAFCPENWLGNQYIPHCYRIYKEPVTYEKAKARCTEEGTRIVPSNTDFDLYFLGAVFEFYSQNDKYFEVTTVQNIWVQDTNNTKRCSAFRTSPYERNIPTLDDVDCLRLLFFMCVKKTIPSGSGYIETRSPYFDQEELLDYEPFEILSLYGVLNRNLQENEVVFGRLPSLTLNLSNSYQQWRFNNASYWTVSVSNRVSVPYYVHIYLHLNQSPQRRRRDSNDNNAYELFGRQKRQGEFNTPRPNENEGGFTTTGKDEGEGVFRFRNYDNIRQTTGYYTFGIYNTNPPRYKQRPPQLVRYSEKDLYIYVAYCNILVNVIGPSSEEPFLSIGDVHSFNLLKDESYLGMFQEMGLNDVFYTTPRDINFLVGYYRSQIESFQENTVKFRVFVAPTLGRNLAENSELVVRDAVFKHFSRNVPPKFFDLTTLKVRSTVMCPFIQTVVEAKNLTFQPIRIGKTGYSWERCYPNNKALATSTCTGGYDSGTTWRKISLANDCGTVPEYNQSNSTMYLKYISETEITKYNYEQILNYTVTLTDPRVNLTERDVIYIAEILYNYLQLDFVNSPEVMTNVFKVVDNVLKSGQDVIDSAQRISNAANRIILSVDELTNKLKLGPIRKNYVQFIQDLVVSEVWEQTGGSNLTIGINLNETDATHIKKESLASVLLPGDVVVGDTDTAIYLTESLVKGGRSKLTFHIYSNPDLFSVISSRYKANSKVVAARLTKNNAPVVDLGDESVTAVFYPFEDSKNLVCAYWNYSANEDAGGWDTDGCTLFSSESGRVVCKCNHLTNFAVLIDLKAYTVSDTDKLVLGIITKVGLIISIIGLGITIVTFLMFKHLRNGRGQQVLVNLSVAMLCSAVLFLVGVNRTDSYPGCIAVSALLHYFILVTFMWMLVEGVLQYLRFVKVLGTYIPKFMIKSMIPAWGIPLIPVIIILAKDYDMYYGGSGYCWLSRTPFLYAFLIPVAVIILTNSVVFTVVMYNLCCRRKNKGMVSNQSERKMAFLHLQAGVSILVILGLTWVFGFLTIDDTRIVFHYLFAIFNAFQGFFIFLLFTAREKQIRKAWRKLCCKKAPYKSTTSGSDTHPRKQSADNTNSTGVQSKSAD